MICQGCSAKVTEKEVILSVGRWSKVKHFNRVCKYALKRGKPCANDCRISDPTLTWEAQEKAFTEQFNNEMKRLSIESIPKGKN